MSIYKFAYLKAVWLVGVLTLLNTTIVQALTPTCGTLLTADTNLDSEMNKSIARISIMLR